MHGALSFANGLLHQLDAPLGFFNRSLKRIAVLTDNDQKLLSQTLKAAIASGANEICARVILTLVMSLASFAADLNAAGKL